MKIRPTRAVEGDPFAGGGGPATLGGWLRLGERLYAEAGVALGQVTTDAHDEVLYLLLHALGMPLDSDARALDRRLGRAEREAVRAILRRRIVERVPAAYLTGEAWLGGRRFYVDERVIIPRSYFLEIIPRLAAGASGGVEVAAEARPRGRRSPPEALRIADVCTGSGCLAILLAQRFAGAKVDAIDLSADALAVAAINVRAHRLARRVALHQSDVFDSVPAANYDLIVSNPPYEPSARVDALPPEFRREPRLALDGGPDGLAVIRKLLVQAKARLSSRGLVLIEVGGLRAAIDREFAALSPDWLATEDGADCVCAIAGPRLRRWAPS